MRVQTPKKVVEEVFVSGVIQFFNKERGFGFINRIGDGRKDYFFHFSEIQGGMEQILAAIKHSLLVIFDISVTPGGRREAVNIKIFDTRLSLEDLETCSVDCPCRGQNSRTPAMSSRTARSSRTKHCHVDKRRVQVC